jgi:glycosyltransferase involved in cell wall biosynthesis
MTPDTLMNDMHDARPFLSIVTACYNEEDNIEILHGRVKAVMDTLPGYRYEHVFIDNASTDTTVAILRRLVLLDPHIRVIVNARNFGQVRSPSHALFSVTGDAIISIVADLQDPPEMIPELLSEWRKGFYAVLCIKRSSEESSIMFWVRKQYYKTAERLSSIETIQNFTGFGLFDRRVMDIARSFGDPYPFFRGMIAEIGLPIKKIYYDQPCRKFGITKNNFYTLYDMGMLGIINHSRVPLRMAVFAGFLGAALSFMIAVIYLILKLVFWNTFSIGLAPMLIGIFFVAFIQLVFLGILGEYVGAIFTQVQRRPYAVELERINYPPLSQADLEDPLRAHTPHL